MKNRAIWKAACLCVVVSGLAAAANADEIPLISTGGTAGSFDFTAFINRTVNYRNSGYDQLDIDISALTGPEAGGGIVAVQGTWTCPGSGYVLVSDASVAAYNGDHLTHYTWADWTVPSETVTPAPSPPTGLEGYDGAPLSTLNLAEYVGTAPSDIARTALYPGASTPPADELFTSFEATWYSTTALSGADFLVARLYVPTGWTPDGVIYTGTFGFSDSSTENSTLVVVPEPATLVLLATGLAGLIASGWRQRRIRRLAYP